MFFFLVFVYICVFFFLSALLPFPFFLFQNRLVVARKCCLLDVGRIRPVLRMTSPSKSSRRRRSAIIASSHGAGSNSHPLSHSHSRRLPFYPSSKIKSSVAWRLLASKAIRRHFAWGRLVEAVSSSARSWLPRPNVLF